MKLVWVTDPHLSFLKRGGAKLTKTYRMYDYGPNPDPQLDLYEGKSHKK